MSEITIVTAFFDVGRGKWQGEFQRSVEEYLAYFKFWARIRNKMVIYAEPQVAKEAMEIRRAFGLQDRTVVIPIDDVTSLEPTIYKTMEEVLANPTVVKFRKRPQNPESYNPAYTYITNMKIWFLKNTVEKNLAQETLAWVDFGYNHGGTYYTNPEEFDFLWTYPFSRKIHFFTLEELDDIPIFELVRTMKTYFSAGIMIVPDILCHRLWELFQENIFHLLACDLCDDEQTVMLMAYRQSPELFSIHRIYGWFEPWKKFGGEHLSVKVKKEKIFVRIKNCLKIENRERSL